MSPDTRCPICDARLVNHNRKDGSGYVIRSRILKLQTNGDVLGKCHQCGAWVRLPLSHQIGSRQDT